MVDTASYELTGDPSPLEAALSSAKGMFTTFGEAAKSRLQLVSVAAKGVWSSMTGGLSGVVGTVTKTLGTIAGAVTAPFRAVASVVTGVFNGVKNVITGAFSALKVVILGAVLYAANQVRMFVSGAYGIVKGLVPLFNVGWFEGITTGIQEFLATESGLFKVANAVKATGMVAGFSTDKLKAMADQMQELTVNGDDAALAAEAVVLQFKNVRGDIFTGALKAAADLSSATGTDLVGAADKLARSLDDPIRGIRTLRSEGIKFSEAEQDMIDMMVKGGNIVKAQQFLLARLAGTFGGAAAAEAQTFGGQIKMLNNQLNDMWKGVAAKLAPAIQAVLPLIKMMSKFTTDAAGAFASWVTAIVTWAADSWPVVMKWASSVLAVVRDTFAKIVDWVVDKLGEVYSFAESVVSHFPKFWEAAKDKIIFYWESLKITVLDTWDSMLKALRIGIVDFMAYMRKSFDYISARVEMAAGDLTHSGESDAARNQRWQDILQKQWLKNMAERKKAAAAVEEESKPSVSKEQRDAVEELGKKAGESGAAFGTVFQSNLIKNQKNIDAVKKGLKSFLGLTTETPDFGVKDALGERGLPSKEDFTIEKEDKRASAFEDLVSLQKRIAGAAFKSPEQQALVSQTAVLKQNHKQNMDKQDKMQKALDKIGKNTEKVFGPEHVGPKFID